MAELTGPDDFPGHVELRGGRRRRRSWSIKSADQDSTCQAYRTTNHLSSVIGFRVDYPNIRPGCMFFFSVWLHIATGNIFALLISGWTVLEAIIDTVPCIYFQTEPKHQAARIYTYSDNIFWTNKQKACLYHDYFYEFPFVQRSTKTNGPKESISFWFIIRKWLVSSKSMVVTFHQVTCSWITPWLQPTIEEKSSVKSTKKSTVGFHIEPWEFLHRNRRVCVRCLMFRTSLMFMHKVIGKTE